MKWLLPIVLLSGCADDVFDVVFNPCEPLVVEPSDAAVLADVAAGIALWNDLVRSRLTLEDVEAARVSIVVEHPSSSLVLGQYDDEQGVIYLNGNLAPEVRTILVAHEIGHAFDLRHVEGRASVMNPHNRDVPPTEDDAAVLEGRWGACP